jgi:hypothetical protein
MLLAHGGEIIDNVALSPSLLVHRFTTSQNPKGLIKLYFLHVINGALLTPIFSPLKILRFKIQHALFGWHYEILPGFSTCVEQEVGSHQRQVYDRYMVFFVQR